MSTGPRPVGQHRHPDGGRRPLTPLEWVYIGALVAPLLLGAVLVFVAILAGRVPG